MSPLVLLSQVNATRVDVDVRVVDVWERLRKADGHKDMHLVCAGEQQLGVHAAVLSAASPVVEAMLQSSLVAAFESQKNGLALLKASPCNPACSECGSSGSGRSRSVTCQSRLGHSS